MNAFKTDEFCHFFGGQIAWAAVWAGRSGDTVKLHFAPLDGALAWVSAHSAISEACTACKQLT